MHRRDGRGKRWIRGRRKDVAKEDAIIAVGGEAIGPPPPKRLGEQDDFAAVLEARDGDVTVGAVGRADERFGARAGDGNGRGAIEPGEMDVGGEWIGSEICAGEVVDGFDIHHAEVSIEREAIGAGDRAAKEIVATKNHASAAGEERFAGGDLGVGDGDERRFGEKDELV